MGEKAKIGPYQEPNMKIMILAVVLATLFQLPKAVAASINCGEEVWLNVPGVQDGLFTGKLKADCSITGVSSGSIKKLSEYFEENAVRGAHIVHSAPAADSSLGMSGVKMDLTVKSEEGLMRSLIRFGNDGSKTFRYVAQSKEINFSGLSEYLRKLDIDVIVSKESESKFKITLINLTQIKKPAIAPTGIFNSMVQKQSKKEFRKNLESLAQEVADNL